MGGVWNIYGNFYGSEGILLDIYGTFTTGNNVGIGTSAKVRCYQSITIEEGSDITLECQVFDTNFHFLQNIMNGRIFRMTDNIHIGKYCWVGNRTTISKGTYLPDYTTVCSNSLINKNFEDLAGKNALIGGVPAKLLTTGLHRIYDDKLELKFFYEFLSNPNKKFIDYEVQPVDTRIDGELRSKHVKEL